MSLPAFSSFDNNAIWSYSSVQFVRTTFQIFFLPMAPSPGTSTSTSAERPLVAASKGTQQLFQAPSQQAPCGHAPAKAASKRVLKELKVRIRDEKKEVELVPRIGRWTFAAVQESFKHRVQLERVDKEKEKLEDEIAEYSPSYLHDKVDGWYNRPWDSEHRRGRHYELHRDYWALYATIGNFTDGDSRTSSFF
ncbi:hypothetical protein C6P46_000587 [Rhodotorula mucilaginosa]|uniref:Uncharacterized protein n=1 Tax=Rhodotorula mucilaginosa TaxID=5537 RepID=A0A9P6W631_RHOMI|nr:hypothetical protein C6P46_000587 [Rhodotorula mucilaginosa]